MGRYQIRGFLGAGGMGHVFTALDPELDRTVALKLVRPDGGGTLSQQRMRLLREAQALAKLQHPNVVAIHDVGTKGNQVFIAMERVAGATLGVWLGAAERSWPEIRDVFVAAGRGLCAAHDVGIIHRDFKPANVIVGTRRVVVVDFGLACARGEDRGDLDSEPRGAASVLDVNVTLSGERVGTPRYMAPEQRLGADVTPHVDQYSFAATLAEALASRSIKVPDRVRAAVARGLAVEPGQRWPSLGRLLDELVHDPATRQRRIFAVVAMAIAAVAAPLAFFAGRQSPAPRCVFDAGGLWDDGTRAEVRAAFAATSKPFALESFEHVDTDIRNRIADWSHARAEACAATEIRHEQSAALMDARMACLGRARQQIDAFVDALRKADAKIVEQSTSSSAGIGEIEACSNGSVLSAVVPAGHDGAAEAIDRESARLGALVLVGKIKEAQAAAPALVEQATQLGEMPVLARTLYQAGLIGCDVGDPHEAADLLYQAARAAGQAHDDLLTARVYVKLVYCVGRRDADAGAGLALAEAAEVALARAGSPLELRARLYRQQARLRRSLGDMLGSFAYAELGLMTNLRLYGEENSEVGRSLGDVGAILNALGGYRGAMAAYAKGLPILERSRGPNHPTVAGHLINMACVVAELGDLDAAVSHFSRALFLQERNLGPDSVAVVLRNLANVRERQGLLEEAADLAQRSLVIDQKRLRADHPELASDFYVLAGIAADRGDLDEADGLVARALAMHAGVAGRETAIADLQYLQALVERQRHDLPAARKAIEAALVAQRKTLGPRHPTVANSEVLLADILLDAGDVVAALPLATAALAVEEATRADDAADVVAARTVLASALLAAGDVPRARSVAARAVAGATSRRQRADIDGRARFVLAQATGDRDLARQARTSLLGWPARDDLERVNRWLAAHQ